jgi:hypothetical protein
MRLASPRITPLEEKDWSPDARAELGRLAESGRVYNTWGQYNNTWGQYNLVSMALNTLGVQLDAGLEGFARWRR